MSIDKSLRRKNTLQRARNVLTRAERIAQLKKEERWPDEWGWTAYRDAANVMRRSIRQPEMLREPEQISRSAVATNNPPLTARFGPLALYAVDTTFVRGNRRQKQRAAPSCLGSTSARRLACSSGEGERQTAFP